MLANRHSLLTERTLVLIYFSWLVVAAGILFGREFLPRQPHPHQNADSLLNAFCNWDGVWYTRITSTGYEFDPQRHSSVAFFPGYPWLARGVAYLSGLHSEEALLLVSQFSLIGAVLALQRLFVERAEPAAETILWTLLLWPPSLFFRMAYAESLFLLCCALLLLGIERRWPLWGLALIVGAATGTRSVGVALCLPWLWDCWHRAPAFRPFFGRVLLWGPLTGWGLIGYLLYLQATFDNPWAFLETQQNWTVRVEPPPFDKLLSLLLLEPLWSVYQPTSPAYWARHENAIGPLFSFQFWNPLYFVATAGLLAYGATKRWLTIPELLMGGGLLAIPYLLQSYRMAMQGHGRFTCVVIPAWFVLGRWLHQSGSLAQRIVFALMAVQLFLWSALFAAWQRVF